MPFSSIKRQMRRANELPALALSSSNPTQQRAARNEFGLPVYGKEDLPLSELERLSGRGALYDDRVLNEERERVNEIKRQNLGALEVPYYQGENNNITPLPPRFLEDEYTNLDTSSFTEMSDSPGDYWDPDKRQIWRNEPYQIGDEEYRTWIPESPVKRYRRERGETFVTQPGTPAYDMPDDVDSSRETKYIGRIEEQDVRQREELSERFGAPHTLSDLYTPQLQMWTKGRLPLSQEFLTRMQASYLPSMEKARELEELAKEQAELTGQESTFMKQQAEQSRKDARNRRTLQWLGLAASVLTPFMPGLLGLVTGAGAIGAGVASTK